MSIVHRSLAVLAAGVAAVALTACTTQLDTEQAQEEIGKQLAEQTGIAAADVSVSCPEDVDLEEGKSFDCDVTGPDGEAKAKVTMTDDEGNITWEMGPKELQALMGA